MGPTADAGNYRLVKRIEVNFDNNESIAFFGQFNDQSDHFSMREIKI